LKAAGEAILLRPIKMVPKTRSGIVIQQERKRHDANISVGEVLDIGPLAFTEEMHLEKEFGISVKRPCISELVMTAKHAGYELKIGEEVYWFVQPLDIIGYITEEEVEALTTW